MADLALRLKIFIASPGDLISERDIVEKLVAEAAFDFARHRLLLQSFRWENGVTPGYERPNARTIRQVRTAELTTVMFWSRLGSAARVGSSETGSLEELRVAGERVSSGQADDVFIYFKTAPAPPGADARDVAEVARVKAALQTANDVLTHDFATPLEFEHAFRHHLRLWTERWVGIPDICEFALDHSGGSKVDSSLLADDRLHQVLMQLDLSQLDDVAPVIGRHAVDTYQRLGPDGWLMPLTETADCAVRALPKSLQTVLIDKASREPDPRSWHVINGPPLVRDSSQLGFATAGWFAFFCAVGLIEAVAAARVEAVTRMPYVNQIHQYLKALARERRAAAAMVPVLRRWLNSEDGCTDNRPIARNFAAYVLGMVGAIDAQDDLVRAIYSDPGRDVRLYAITALGKLRARQQMPVLKELFFQEFDPAVRLTIAQAVCRMTGVADYEM